jgi:hypothetical protein
MKNLQDLKDIISKITYKPGWTFLVTTGKSFLGEDMPPYLQIQFDAPDNFTGQVERQHCRKWQLSYHMTTTEIVRTCFLAALQAERHESEELFRYKGYDIFNSHINVEHLVELQQDRGLNLYEYRAKP